MKGNIIYHRCIPPPPDFSCSRSVIVHCRHFNEFAKSHDSSGSREPMNTSGPRGRTISSPIPHHFNATPAKPISPSNHYNHYLIIIYHVFNCLDLSHCPTVSDMSSASLSTPVRCTYHSQPTMSSSLPSMSPPTSGFFMPPHSSSSQSQMQYMAHGSLLQAQQNPHVC